MNEKSLLRKDLRARVGGLSPFAKAAAAAALCQKLAADERTRQARVLGVFLPLSDEPDVRPWLRAVAEGGQTTLAIPVEENSVWEFRRLGEGGRPVPTAELDLILVPGLGFTRAGDRLGRGKGIYDRLLADYRGHARGIAFACQEVPALPREPHDVRLAEVWFG